MTSEDAIGLAIYYTDMAVRGDTLPIEAAVMAGVAQSYATLALALQNQEAQPPARGRRRQTGGPGR